MVEPPGSGALPYHMKSDVYLSIRCQFASDWTAEYSEVFGDLIGNGGAYRDRTDDPLLAKQVLSQLSYSPKKLVFFGERGKCKGSLRQVN